MPTFISAPHIRHPAGRLKAMRINPAVAITIDTEGFPPDMLLVRGRAEVTEVDGVDADYALSARRYLGERDAEEYLRQINHPSTRMARISVRPTWVGVVDFRSRPPGPLGGPQPGATNRLRITSADRELHPPVRRQRTSAGRPERGHSVGRGSATSVGSHRPTGPRRHEWTADPTFARCSPCGSTGRCARRATQTPPEARNLAADDNCALATSTDGIDFIVEGTAAHVTDHEVLERIAAAYHTKYEWPVTVIANSFDAPYGAPAAGPPPYRPSP